MKVRLGEILIEAGVISEEQLQQALEIKKTRSRLLGPLLIDLGFATHQEVAKALAGQLNLRLLGPGELRLHEPSMDKLAPSFCQQYGVLPVMLTHERHTGRRETLVLAMSDSVANDLSVLDFARSRLGQDLEPAIANDMDIINVLANRFGTRDMIDTLVDQLGVRDDFQFVNTLGESFIIEGLESESAPTVQIVSTLIADAIESRATDVHVEPRVEGVQVRYRIDGQLRDAVFLPAYAHAAIISRIKVMADMDITEKRSPQDGHLKARHHDRVVDLRVSTLPTAFGEKAVLRILDRATGVATLGGAGFDEDWIQLIEDRVRRPQGCILVTGPTGSGKSTTLYTCLEMMRSETNNVVTIEDPIERYIAGINQVQVLEAAGMTFANGLRSILRQDPDVVMVGEVRDGETAEIAMRASLTGHLVLSTIHSNDAVATITRLADIGIDRYLMASSLTLIIAQRLVRRVCRECTTEYKPTEQILDRVERFSGTRPEGPFIRGQGCERCHGTGYAGRTVVYEVLPITEEVRQLINMGATEMEVVDTAIAGGMRSMFQVGVDKACRGETTLEEVLLCVPAARRTFDGSVDVPSAATPPRALPEADPRGGGRELQPLAAGSMAPSDARPRVIVIEGDKLTRSFIASVIRQRGCDVIEAVSGKVGVRLVQSLNADLAIVGSDMPDLDNFTVCAEITYGDASFDTPVVFVMDSHDPNDREQAHLLGAREVILKPFSGDEMARAVQSVLNGRTALTQVDTSA